MTACFDFYIFVYNFVLFMSIFRRSVSTWISLLQCESEWNHSRFHQYQYAYIWWSLPRCFHYPRTWLVDRNNSFKLVTMGIRPMAAIFYSQLTNRFVRFTIKSADCPISWWCSLSIYPTQGYRKGKLTWNGLMYVCNQGLKMWNFKTFKVNIKDIRIAS